MANDLAGPTDLSHLPGAPFTEEEVDAAVYAVREAAGWHIAPQRAAETHVFDIHRGVRRLRLPTKALTSVDAIRDDDGELISADEYQVSHKLATVRRADPWHEGYESIEVDMTHGYATTPPDLLAVIAEAAVIGRTGASTASSVKLGDLSISGGSVSAGETAAREPLSTAATLRRYTLWTVVLG